MDSALIAAYGQPTHIPFSAIRIVLKSGPVIRWTDGGFVKIGDEVFVARDDYAVFSAVSGSSDAVEGSVSTLTLTVLPVSPEALAALASPLEQGSAVTWLEGVIDPQTGTPIGTPETKFTGLLDFGRMAVGESWSLTLECITWEALQKEPRGQQRLTHVFHQQCFDGELGLAFIAVPRTVRWRMENPKGAGGGGGGVNDGFGSIVMDHRGVHYA